MNDDGPLSHLRHFDRALFSIRASVPSHALHGSTLSPELWALLSCASSPRNKPHIVFFPLDRRQELAWLIALRLGLALYAVALTGCEPPNSFRFGTTLHRRFSCLCQMYMPMILVNSRLHTWEAGTYKYTHRLVPAALAYPLGCAARRLFKCAVGREFRRRDEDGV